MQISREEVLNYHIGGKIGLNLTKNFRGINDLCLAYTPGVAMAVKEIAANPQAIYKYTAKSNLVAIVTDGSAILGLGDLGPAASIPVMEGKAVLFKAFADVDAWPVPLNNCRLNGTNSGKTDPQRIIDICCALAPTYGGINLEDIAAPACFEIEDKLEAMLDIPVFHDDQWGTAVITLSAVKNYCFLSDRKIDSLKIVINGAGAAGIRIAEMLKADGAQDVVICDSKGVLRKSRTDLTGKKLEHAVDTQNKTVFDALKGAHVLIGVSVANCINGEHVKSMADHPAIFAMANPDPEIHPDTVKNALGSKPYVMATGRSDFPNQINNVLGFPFIFRGALDAGSKYINIEMKVAAADALAVLARSEIPEEVTRVYGGKKLEFGPECIIPKPFDKRLFVDIPLAVAVAAVKSGVAPATLNAEKYRQDLIKRNSERRFMV